MSNPYVRSFRVRAYECDSLSHVNNTVYQHYIEQATSEAVSAWSANQPDNGGWRLRQISIEYLRPGTAGDVLDVSTWVSDSDQQHVQREYEVDRPSDREVIARASANWWYVDRATFQPCDIPPDLACTFGATGEPILRPNRLPAQGLDTGSFRWRHQVTRYELDATGYVNSAVMLSWVEEAKFRAAEIAGWSVTRMQAENFVTVQIRHDTEYFLPARYGDEIEIISRLYDLRTVRGTWLHEIYRFGSRELLARNYSSGAFLNLEGHPARAPQAMLDDLKKGEAELGKW